MSSRPRTRSWKPTRQDTVLLVILKERNDNQITLTLAAGSNSTGHLFVDTPNTCVAPSVVSTDPANGQTGVLLSDNTLTVTFDQPMITYGGGSVLDKGNFNNKIDNPDFRYGDVDILAVSYDPNTYTATLTIDTI